MSQVYGQPVARFQVHPGIYVCISAPGTTCRETVGGWIVSESGGHVEIRAATDLDDDSTWHEPMHSYDIDRGETQSERADAARAMVREALSAISRHMLEREIKHEYENWAPLLLEGSIRVTSRLLAEDDAPDLLIASVCDDLRNSYMWIWDIVDELDLPGLPDFEWDVEIPLVGSGMSNAAVAERLKAAADHFQESLVGVVRSVDARAARIRMLPSLVAAPYSYIGATRSFQERFDALTKAFEATVRSLLSVALIPVAGDTREERVKHLRTIGKKPTLGVYVSKLRENATSLEALLPATYSALQTPGGKDTRLAEYVFTELTPTRNRLGPHGGLKPDASYVAPTQAMAAWLEELLQPLAADGHSTMPVVLAGLQVGRGDSAYDYSLVELRGDTVSFPRTRVLSDQKIEEQRVYLLDSKTGRFVDSDPLLYFGVCPECSFEEAFFLDDFTVGAPEWFSFRGGHRVS